MKTYASKVGFLALFIALLLCSSNGAGLAQEAPRASNVPANPISGWSGQLNIIAEQLKNPNLSDDVLLQRRDELEAIRGGVRNWIADQAPNVETIQNELAALGKPPGKDEEPEAAGVAAQRQQLRSNLATTTGLLKEADLIVERANRLIGQIWQIRRDRFAEKIMTRGSSPLSPGLWRRAILEMTWIAETSPSVTAGLVIAPEFQDKLRKSIFVILAAILFAIVLVWPVHRWVLRRYGRDPTIAEPSFIQALRASIAVATARALLPTLAAALIYIVVIGEDIVTDAGKDIAWALFLGIVLFTWSIAFVRASLSPADPTWRIVPVPTNFARGARGIAIGLALAFAIDLVLSEIIAAYMVGLAVSELRDYILTVVVAALLLVLMLRQQMWMPDDGTAQSPRWRSLRVFVAVTLIVLLVLGAWGWVALARLAVTQMVITGGLIVLVLMLHQLGREFIRYAVSRETLAGDWLRSSLRMDEDSAARFEFWAGLAYVFLLVVFAVVVGLFVWGADRKDVADWVSQAIFGFRIGRITFSLADQLIAAVLFAGFVIVSRFLQRMLADRILPNTHLDLGIRQSITTAFGYLGIIVAAVIGISALGLDLSNLAIVVGALSVGIGFGLQNVVNNFVSGLILLIERPVKVGDWVVVDDKQGYVKRIKVRATEIQTFDRASVFIPNSKLISDAVTNWTYADKLGRIIIPVGVAYGSNTALVRDILLAIAHENSSVQFRAAVLSPQRRGDRHRDQRSLLCHRSGVPGQGNRHTDPAAGLPSSTKLNARCYKPAAPPSARGSCAPSSEPLGWITTAPACPIVSE
jgi:potassium-dependent mechanosensitive channel